MQRQDLQPRFLGVAGSPQSETERAALKQAVFLFRYRLRLLDAVADPA